MSAVANVLLPIFALVALGAALPRVRFLPVTFFRDSNRLVFWVAMPAYLFYKSAETQLEGDAAVRVIAAVVGGMIISLATAYLLALIIRLPRQSVSAFSQGAYRGNMAYVGLPVILLALAAGGLKTPVNEAIAVLTVAVITPIYNFVAVFVLVGGQETHERRVGKQMRELLVRLVTNPLLVSCLAGLVVMALGWKLPGPLRESLRLAGDIATPLALLGIGSTLTFKSLRLHWPQATAASIIKLVVSPAAGLALAVPLRLAGAELLIALLFLATPTAAASYIMAQQMGADDALAANVIVVTTLLSLPAFAVVLALAR